MVFQEEPKNGDRIGIGIEMDRIWQNYGLDQVGSSSILTMWGPPVMFVGL